MLFLTFLALGAALFTFLYLKGDEDFAFWQQAAPAAAVFGAVFAALKVAGWTGVVIPVILLFAVIFMITKGKWGFSAGVKELVFLLLAIAPTCYCLIKSLYGVYGTWQSLAVGGTVTIATMAVIVGAFLYERGTRRLWPLITAIILVAALWVTTGVVAANNATPEGTVTETAVTEAKTKVTVDIDKIVAQKKFSGISKELLYNSLSPKDEERIATTGFNDAVSFPVTGTTAKAQLTELQEEILRNPVYGVGMARFLGGLKFPDGSNVGKVNPWLAEFINKNDNATNGLNQWLEAESETSPVLVTDEYRRYAGGVATLLGLFSNKGTQTRQTVENWPLSLTGLDSQRKLVQDTNTDNQYSKPSLVYQYAAKNGTVLLEFGINTADKRPEIFGNTVVPTVITESTGGGGGGGGGDTPTPSPEPEPDPPTGCSDEQTWEPSYGQEAEHNKDDDHSGGNVEWRVKEERSTGETEDGEYRHSGVTDPEWWTTPETTNEPTTSGGEGTPDISEGNNEGGGLLLDD